MNVLVACEFSGIVRDAFISKGHNAISCDFLPTEKPGPHYQGDVFNILDGLPLCPDCGRLCQIDHNSFRCDYDHKLYPFKFKKDFTNKLLLWDLIIAHPPCDNLTSAGAAYWPEKQKDGRQSLAIEFVLKIFNSPCNKIAIENPVGILSTKWRKPDQIIHPYYFGEPFLKRTCLWLKNLPALFETDRLEKPQPMGHCIKSNGRKYNYYFHQSKNSHERSRSFSGIANAMAEQWGRII